MATLRETLDPSLHTNYRHFLMEILLFLFSELLLVPPGQGLFVYECLSMSLFASQLLQLTKINEIMKTETEKNIFVI